MIQVVVSGAAGQAIVGTDTRLFVLKPGFMAGATFGAEVTSWSYRNLAGVQVHKGLMTGAVVIQAPGQSGRSSTYWGQRKDDPYKAPNAIPVAGNWGPVRVGVARLQDLIDTSHANPGVAPAVPPSNLSSASIAEEVQKLAELLSSGVLTEEEFAAAKQRLIGG